MTGDCHVPFCGSPGVKFPGLPDYAFDRWMDREHPGCPFERYADDVVVHCDTEEQARRLSLDPRIRPDGDLGLS